MMTPNTFPPLSFLLALVLLSGGCTARRISPSVSPTLGGKLYTSAWIQRSAEYKALCMQAYNMATRRVEDVTREQRPAGAKPLAIVTDIDETILDNTPNSVYEALRGKTFDQDSWRDWCAQAQADTLAGAQGFFRYAADKGITIFYVTNRQGDEREGTLANLRKYGFPFADEAYLITKEGTSNKEPRRAQIDKDFEIVLLLGDNLGDFEHIFDSEDEAVRHRALGQFAHDFGTRFIILPNPNYGTWEKAMNGGSTPLYKQDSILLHSLRTHKP